MVLWGDRLKEPLSSGLSLCWHVSTKDASFSLAGVTSPLHSVQIKWQKESKRHVWSVRRELSSPSMGKHVRQKTHADRIVSCVCVRSWERQPQGKLCLLLMFFFFFMCQVTWLGKEAAFNHCEAEIMEWWGNWNTLNCFLVDGRARIKGETLSGTFLRWFLRPPVVRLLCFMSIHGANWKNPIWRSKQWNFPWQAADTVYCWRPMIKSILYVLQQIIKNNLCVWKLFS